MPCLLLYGRKVPPAIVRIIPEILFSVCSSNQTFTILMAKDYSVPDPLEKTPAASDGYHPSLWLIPLKDCRPFLKHQVTSMFMTTLLLYITVRIM